MSYIFLNTYLCCCFEGKKYFFWIFYFLCIYIYTRDLCDSFFSNEYEGMKLMIFAQLCLCVAGFCLVVVSYEYYMIRGMMPVSVRFFATSLTFASASSGFRLNWGESVIRLEWYFLLYIFFFISIQTFMTDKYDWYSLSCNANQRNDCALTGNETSARQVKNVICSFSSTWWIVFFAQVSIVRRVGSIC